MKLLLAFLLWFNSPAVSDDQSAPKDKTSMVQQHEDKEGDNYLNWEFDDEEKPIRNKFP